MSNSLNRSFKVIWSISSNAWIAVSEITKSHGKQKSASRRCRHIFFAGAMVSGASIAAPPTPNQLPIGGTVATGTATINTTGSTMNINQSSNRAAINWNGFDIGSNATVNFVQPSTSAVALNRISSSNPSQIYGNLNANGQVYLMNSAGIYFAPGANVNVGGIVATTHQMGDADFMNGSNTFSRNGATGSVVNDGTIKSGIGGYIALLAPDVQNKGVLVAQQGTIALAGGEAITLNFGDLAKLNSLTIAPSLIKTLVENKLAVQAPDGLIILSARAVNQLTGSVINSGSIQADGITQSGGRIILEASSSITHSGSMSANAAPSSISSGGTISVIADLDNPSSTTSINGNISAQGGSLGGNGGNIETSASKVQIGANASINTSATQGNTGTWTIDPSDYTIAASGGNMTGASLSSALSTNSVNILSSSGSSGTGGNINVNDAITWSSNSALTLNAQNNININSSITTNGSNAVLAFQYGQGAVSTGNASNYYVNAPINLQSGNNFSTKAGSNGATINYTVINSLGAAGSIGGNDLQGINGSLGGNFALGSNLFASATLGWNSGAGFTPIGSITAPFTGKFDGLGHNISGLTINQLGNPNIGLFGVTHGATEIQNIGLLAGSTIGAAGTGGLVGNNDAGLINNSYNTGSVTGAAGTGGLVGSNISGNLTNDYATGSIKGAAGTGGLLGSSTTGSVSNSYATGLVDGTLNKNIDGIGAAGIGGLVGSITSGNISNSYATGNIFGAAGSGGLVGSMTSGKIDSSYATGNIYGAAGTGGVAGSTDGLVTNVYATGNVVGAAGTSALVGGGASGAPGSLSVTNSVGTGAANGVATVNTFTNSTAITVTTTNISTIYNGLTYSSGYSVSYSAALDPAKVLGTLSYSGSSLSAINVGNYSIVSSGLISSPAYTYTFVNGGLAITKANLSLAGTQVYNGTTTFAGSNLTASGVAGQTFAVSGSGATDLTSANVQSNQALANVANLSLGTSNNGGLASNYNVLSTVGSAVNITPAALLVSGATTSNVYTGATQTNTYSANLLSTADKITGITGLATGTNVSTQADSLSAATGTGLSNYNITYANGGLAITPLALTVAGTTTNNTIYNGTTTASLSSGTLSNLPTNGTIVTLNQSGTYASANAGLQSITATDTLAGNVLGNYTLTQPTGLSGLIRLAPLTITANNSTKLYGTTANLGTTAFTTSGLVNNEVISNVALASTGSVSTATVTGAPYAITARNPIGTGTFLTSNYGIAYVNGKLSVTSAQLSPNTLIPVNPAQLTNNQNIQSLIAGDKIIPPAQNTNTSQVANTSQAMNVTKDPFVIEAMNKLIETSNSVRKVFYDTAQLDEKLFDKYDVSASKIDVGNSILVPIQNPSVSTLSMHESPATQKIIKEAFSSNTGHMTRVADLSLAIARNLNLSREVINEIFIAAKLHDIGLPNALSNLSASDFAYQLINESQLGYQKLKEANFSQTIAEMVQQHHERIDGSGFMKLSGDAISIGGRILAVADTLESLSGHGAHLEAREPINMNLALQSIHNGSGWQFDPKIVQSCMNIFSAGYHFPTTQQTVHQEIKTA